MPNLSCQVKNRFVYFMKLSYNIIVECTDTSIAHINQMSFIREISLQFGSSRTPSKTKKKRMRFSYIYNYNLFPLQLNSFVFVGTRNWLGTSYLQLLFSIHKSMFIQNDLMHSSKNLYLFVNQVSSLRLWWVFEEIILCFYWLINFIMDNNGILLKNNFFVVFIISKRIMKTFKFK